MTFIENHDQIANSGRGLRAHQLTSPARYRAMMALLLLSPGTPMLFQGQEFAASTPFFYFADHNPQLAELVSAGRVEFLGQFRSLADPQMEGIFAMPHEPETFERCKLDFRERETHAPQYRHVKDLLKLRRSDPAFRAQKWRGVDGAILGTTAFVLRFFQHDGADRLLIVNLGRDLHLERVADPLLAPPAGYAWHTAFSTEDPTYGGMGIAPLKAADESDLKLQLECAFLTLACPLGMDTVLATPWRAFQMLPDNNYVLGIFKQVLQASGTDVLRQVRKLYRK